MVCDAAQTRWTSSAISAARALDSMTPGFHPTLVNNPATPNRPGHLDAMLPLINVLFASFRRRRRAAKPILIALVVVELATVAGGFWCWRTGGSKYPRIDNSASFVSAKEIHQIEQLVARARRAIHCFHQYRQYEAGRALLPGMAVIGFGLAARINGAAQRMDGGLILHRSARTKSSNLSTRGQMTASRPDGTSDIHVA